MDANKEQLIAYIKEQIKHGTQESKILNTIKNNGWAESDYIELSAEAKKQIARELSSQLATEPVSANINYGWRKYFLPIENKLIVPTLVFGLIIFLSITFYQMVHSYPFSPSFSSHDIYYSFLQWGLVSIVSFFLTVHSPIDDFGRRLGILAICTVIMIVVLILTLFNYPESWAIIFLPLGNFLGGLTGVILGIIARATLNFKAPILKAFIIIVAVLIIPAITISEYVVYANSPTLTESKCRWLGAHAEIECFKRLAVETNDPIACEGTEGDSLTMAKCYDELTDRLLKEGHLDPAICLKIPIHEGAMGEGFTCVYQIAKKLEDITKCEVLPGGEFSMKEGCITKVTQNFINLEPKARLEKCTSLGSVVDEKTCYSSLNDSFYNTEYYNKQTGKMNYCDLLSSPHKETCYN